MRLWASADATWFRPSGQDGDLRVSNVTANAGAEPGTVLVTTLRYDASS